MIDDLRPPYRIAFDNARDPYSARNALGIMGTGAGFITSVTAPLSVTGGNLTIDLSGYQPLDADLTAIAALSGTNTIYYRSAANTWSAVNVSTGLSFTGGNLTATGGGGNVSNSGTPAANDLAQWVTSTTIKGLPIATHRTNATFTTSLTVNGFTLVSNGGTNLYTQLGGGGGVGSITFNGSAGTDPYIDMYFHVKGSGHHYFQSNSGLIQFAVFPTASATRYIQATGAVGPAQAKIYSSAGGVAIEGTATNDSAAAGYVGEYIKSDVALGSAVALTTGTGANVTSISLTAGDWDVAIQGFFVGGATTNCTQGVAVVTTTSTSITDTANGNRAFLQCPNAGLVGAANIWGLTVPMCRVSLTTTTTVYFVAYANFTVSTLSAFGTIIARRIR